MGSFLFTIYFLFLFIQVTFHVLNIGSHIKEDGTANMTTLGPAITNMNPNILILAYCVSHESSLNEDLTAVGIYANLIMQKDLLQITGGR